MNKISFLLIVLVLIGCNTERSKIGSSLNLEVVHVDPSKAKHIKLSDLYAEISLVKLETNAESLLGEVNKLIVDESAFYMVSRQAVHVFDRAGNYKLSIKSPGKGPGEYTAIADAIVDEDSGRIMIYDGASSKVLIYSPQGDFIEEWDTGLNGFAFAKINDASYALYIGSNYSDNADYRLNIISKPSTEINGRFFKIKENEAKFLHFGDLTNFSHHNGKVSFLYSFNDTVYTVENVNVFPRFHIDFGKKRLPASFLENSYTDVRDFLETCKETGYAFRIIGFFESDNHIAFSFMYQHDIVHAYYEKHSKQSFVVKAFTHDLLFNGLSVPSSFGNLPKATFENDFFTIMDAYEFVSNMESAKAKMTSEEWATFESAYPGVVQTYKITKADDNPVIMVGKMHNSFKRL